VLEEAGVKSSTIAQISGPPEERMHELREHVLFLLHNRGMQHLLEAMIAVIEKQNADRPEAYLQLLITDLRQTYNNYMARYDDEDLDEDP
jgi:hypothetical protein